VWVAWPASSRRFAFDESSRKETAEVRSGLAGKPSAASRRAGSRIVSRGSDPNRSWSANHPSTQPGTVTERMSSRYGITVWPSERSWAASLPVAARPDEFNACTSPSRWTRAKRSPPIPQSWGPTTVITAFVAIAASAALPLRWNISTPAEVAR